MSTDPVASPEDMQKGTDVAQAGMDAAAAQPTPQKAKAAATRAMRQRAEALKLEFSQEHADMIADALIRAMEQRGAFDPPPDPVAPPPAVASPDAAQIAASAPPPRKRSFAEKFRGV